jgi:hypothetical protein
LGPTGSRPVPGSEQPLIFTGWPDTCGAPDEVYFIRQQTFVDFKEPSLLYTRRNPPRHEGEESPFEHK